MEKSILEMLPEGSYKLDRIVYNSEIDNGVHKDIQYHTIITLEVNDDISVFINVEENIATIFFNDIELVIRMNKFAGRIFGSLRDANLHYQTFLLQLLRRFEIEQTAAI